MLKKEIKRCDGEFNTEKHLKVKYRCLECGSFFCEKCYEDTLGECMFCSPPKLVEIKKLIKE